MFFEVTYTDGSVEEIEADEYQDNGARYLTTGSHRQADYTSGTL
jgi:hypothetical protein